MSRALEILREDMMRRLQVFVVGLCVLGVACATTPAQEVEPKEAVAVEQAQAPAPPVLTQEEIDRADAEILCEVSQLPEVMAAPPMTREELAIKAAYPKFRGVKMLQVFAALRKGTYETRYVLFEKLFNRLGVHSCAFLSLIAEPLAQGGLPISQDQAKVDWLVIQPYRDELRACSEQALNDEMYGVRLVFLKLQVTPIGTVSSAELLGWDDMKLCAEERAQRWSFAPTKSSREITYFFSVAPPSSPAQ